MGALAGALGAFALPTAGSLPCRPRLLCSLAATVVIGAVNVASTLVGVLLIDRLGRRPLLLEGGIQMMLSQVGTAGWGGGATGPAVRRQPRGLLPLGLLSSRPPATPN